MPTLVLAEHAENEIRKDFTVSERVEIGKAIEAELGKRQGQRTDLANDGQLGLLTDSLPVNCKEVAGKQTAAIAADKAGFDSEATYRRAKAVAEHAEPELVVAMDQEAVAISAAARLVTAPKATQQGVQAGPPT